MKLDTIIKKKTHQNIFYAEKRIKLKKLKNKNVLAFSGLGNNDNFVNKLRKLKITFKSNKKLS